MEKKRVVVALGGNALGKNVQEQLAFVKHTASIIADLIEKGYEVIVGHGNGPQIGMINLAMDEYAIKENTVPMPFPECGAMSQGYIGYHLQQSIFNELKSRNIQKNVVTVVTQVVIDKNDEAFENPTKPVGLFYSKEQAEAISKEKGFKFVEDSGRGYRRVVPSPNPIKIVEIDTINELLNSGTIVITVGGGGIPVADDGYLLNGIPAVIDKDKSCSTLASSLKADILLILTAVDYVYINFNTENQKALSKLSVNEAINYCNDGYFAKGSMLPKIEACINFIKKVPSGLAVISSLEKAKDALEGNVGTIIYNERNVVNIND